MAVVTFLGQTFNTTSGTHTVVGTPKIGDLIVIIRANTGNVTSHAPTDNNSSGTYTLVTSALKASSADLMEVWVRKVVIPAASSTTFTDAAGTTTGGGLAVYAITGVQQGDYGAIRQFAADANHAASATPTPTFAVAPLTGNPIISAVFNATSPGGVTARSSPAYTRDADVGYATPTTGFDCMHIDSGETTAAIAWGGTSASIYCDIAIEINMPIVTPIISLSDDFNDNSTDLTKWGGAFGTYSETGGQLVNTYTSGSSNYSGYKSTSTYDMTGKCCYSQVINAGNQALASLQAIPVELDLDASNKLVWYIGGNLLHAQKVVAGVSTDIDNWLAYNSSLHKWFRIAEKGGITYWDWSTDGNVWNTYAAAPNPIAVTALSPVISTGCFAAEVSGTTATFDNFNPPIIGKDVQNGNNNLGANIQQAVTRAGYW